MGFVVDVHELADGSVSIFLGSGKRLVAEKFLDSAQIGAVGKQVGGKSMTQRVRVQVPIHVCQTHVFFHDAPNGTLREAAASIVKKNSLAVRRPTMTVARPRLQQKLIAHRPVSL